MINETDVKPHKNLAMMITRSVDEFSSKCIQKYYYWCKTHCADSFSKIICRCGKGTLDYCEWEESRK